MGGGSLRRSENVFCAGRLVAVCYVAMNNISLHRFVKRGNVINCGRLAGLGATFSFELAEIPGECPETAFDSTITQGACLRLSHVLDC